MRYFFRDGGENVERFINHLHAFQRLCCCTSFCQNLDYQVTFSFEVECCNPFIAKFGSIQLIICPWLLIVEQPLPPLPTLS